MADPGTDYVSANYRYIAAYNEVSARIAQRQQSLTIYVTLSLGLLAAVVTSHNLGGPAALYSEWILCGFPVASICLTFLNFKYEHTITNLRRYLADLERLNNPGLALPSYNTEPRWALGANHGRRWHDYACATLIAGANAAAVGTYCSLYSASTTGRIIAGATIAVAAACIAIHFLISRFSYRPGS